MNDRNVSKLNKFQMVRYLSDRALSAFGDPLAQLQKSVEEANKGPNPVKKRSTKRKSSGKKAKRHG